VNLAVSIFALAVLSGAAAFPQTATPPARAAHRRRPPAPDSEKETLRKKLSDANGTIGALESQVLDLTAETASLRQKLDANAMAAAELQRRLEAANQSVTSLQARLKSAEEHAEKLASEKEKTQIPASQPSPIPPGRRTPSVEEARLEAQIADITRRRDNYIASILRRYRELANEYRSFGSSFSVPNERDPATKSGPEMTRIQNTIAMVEDDLRQVNGLEGQAVLVRKALEKARKP
jgi:septal ring factor EnvC (AmiA/AmiB activator)